MFLTDIELTSIRDSLDAAAGLDAELMERCGKFLRRGEYDDAVLKAFLVLEKRMRKIAQKPGVAGVNLAQFLLGPNGPIGTKLNDFNGQREAWLALYTSAFHLFRNQAAHTVPNFDVVQAKAIIGMVNMLLQFLERPNKPKAPVKKVPEKKPRGGNTTSAKRGKWDADKFFQAAAENITEPQLSKVRAIYDFAKTSPYKIKWGSGKERGSFSLALPELSTKSLVSIYSDGQLMLNFGWLAGKPALEAKRDALKTGAVHRLGLTIGQDYRKEYPGFSIDAWAPQAEELIGVLKDLEH
jgi:hypothetical protein